MERRHFIKLTTKFSINNDLPTNGMVRVAKGDIGVATATVGFTIFGPVRFS
jgi:hypothetical protein